MFFDESKTQYVARSRCVLIDHGQGKKLISCRLEFECTNKTVEYEALVQGLKKAIDLKVRYIKVFGDSKIIIRQVRNNKRYGIFFTLLMHLILLLYLVIKI
jgi:ribonuclease HI